MTKKSACKMIITAINFLTMTNSVKNFLLTISFILAVGCNEKVKNKHYTDFRDLNFLSGYEKVSDTSYSKEGYEITHRVTKLRKENRTVVLFASVSLDENRRELYSLLDTLTIPKLPENSFLTIGYCYMDSILGEEHIVLVEKTKEPKIKNILKAWRADHRSKQFEEIKNFETMDCFNERFGFGEVY